MYWDKKNTSDNERYLEQELYDAREQLERDRQEREREFQERRAEERERWNGNMRTANTWPESLVKQSHLFSHEVEYEYDPTGETGHRSREDDYFAQSKDACDRAYELWHKNAAYFAAEKKQITERLVQIDRQIRHYVAQDLLAERKTEGWVSVANTLQDPDADPSEWLNW